MTTQVSISRSSLELLLRISEAFASEAEEGLELSYSRIEAAIASGRHSLAPDRRRSQKRRVRG